MSHPADCATKCDEIAELVFPHVSDRNRQNRLAVALVELTEILGYAQPLAFRFLPRTSAEAFNCTGQPTPGASIPTPFLAEIAKHDFPEPPLPDSQLANDGACT